MDNKHIKSGMVIRIKGATYEVLYTREEADPAPYQDPPIRKFFGVYLHKLISRSMGPTHLIKFYEDGKNSFTGLEDDQIIAEDIEYEK